MKKEQSEIKKLNAICFWLIDKCIESNATKITITQENVIKKIEKLGNWEIVIRKIGGKIKKEFKVKNKIK